jgi:hypothetical protein
MNEEYYNQYQVNDALQQKQLDAQTTLYAPQLQEQVQQTQAILVEQTDPKNIIKDIMLILQGKEEQADGTFIQVVEPKLNKSGLEAMWFWLKSHINQNIILSNFEQTDIRNFMDAIQDDLVDELSLNWRIYGVKSKTDLDTINNSILGNIYAALNRAKGQNEKNWLGKISVENISGGQRPPMPKKEGFWSKFRL